MLRSLNHLASFVLGATDGEIGKVHSFLFDGSSWTVRYLVADTGKWLPGRKALIATNALGEPDWGGRVFPVSLKKEQVKSAPDIDADKPVSRQREIELHQHYSWGPYWGGTLGPVATTMVPDPKSEQEIKEAAKGDPNLRSTREVARYRIHATDGDIGHVDDFIADDENWVIRYLAVDTRNWLPGRTVLMSPDWVESISWEEKRVHVDVDKATVENSPPYDPSQPINREYETQVYDYYGRPHYWK
jgi:hypothetical protein